jgi:CubicO group peptidase (beta-lactamase class C family)
MTRSLRGWRGGVIIAILVLLAGWAATWEPDLGDVQARSLVDLERELDALRQQLRIPGLSAAIGEGDRIVWARGFGMANVERGVAAGPDTIYHLASVTKPYASTVLLQLVEEGRLDLNAPVARFGIAKERSTPVRVWHLLSHTSDEPPGMAYRYDGNAFGELTHVVERITGRPFAKDVAERIIRPLGLTQTAPNPGQLHGFSSLFVSLSVRHQDIQASRAIFDASGLNRGQIEGGLAQGYARSWGRSIWPAGLLGPMRPMPHGITLSATGGLVASAPDVARFSIALDQGRLLKDATRRRAWTATVAPDGQTLPYALGWFVQSHHGYQLVWHYGHMLEASSLIVKIPRQQLTFVVLANSDGLSRWRRLGDDADLLTSPAARLFLNWAAIPPQ